MKTSQPVVRYQTALSTLLKFWHLNGRCKYCPYRADIKQLIEQQIAIKEVRVFIKK